MFHELFRTWTLFYVLPGLIGGNLSFLGVRAKPIWLKIPLWLSAIITVILALARHPGTVEPLFVLIVPLFVHVALREVFGPRIRYKGRYLFE